jgi:hypothetical protein
MKTFYDDLGRRTATVENHKGGAGPHMRGWLK